MAIFKVCGSTYTCESLSSFSKIEHHLQATIVGPDDEFSNILNTLFKSKDKKKFKVSCFHGEYKGKFRVIDICNTRVIVIRLYDVEK
jgi:hypothetical protein